MNNLINQKKNQLIKYHIFIESKAPKQLGKIPAPHFKQNIKSIHKFLPLTFFPIYYKAGEKS